MLTMLPAALALAMAAPLAPAPPIPAGVPTQVSALVTAPTGPTTTAEQRIADLLPGRMSDRRIGPTISMLVADARTGRIVFERKPDRPLMPASNMKIATAMAVLQTAGPSARFTTKVVRGATSRQVILVGGADPILTSSDLAELARDTADDLVRGRRVTVRIDDSILPAPTSAQGWRSDYEPYVVAPVRGLTRLGLYAMDTTSVVGQQFVSLLRARGIDARLGRDAVAPADAPLIGLFDDNTVSEAVRVMMPPSENNVAELLMRHVAIARGLEPTWQNSSRAMRQVLRSLGVPMAGVVIKDGSGVSRDDRLTNRALVALLRLAADRAYPRFADLWFKRGMPVSGQTGTLASRYQSGPSACAAGKVVAKTGTLFDVVALSGLTRGRDGRLKVFSILVNDRPQSVWVGSTRDAVDTLAATVNGCY